MVGYSAGALRCVGLEGRSSDTHISYTHTHPYTLTHSPAFERIQRNDGLMCVSQIQERRPCDDMGIADAHQQARECWPQVGWQLWCTISSDFQNSQCSTSHVASAIGGGGGGRGGMYVCVCMCRKTMNLKQKHKLDRRFRKCTDISICRLHSVCFIKTHRTKYCFFFFPFFSFFFSFSSSGLPWLFALYCWRAEKSWLTTCLILQLQTSALFVTSLIQTAGHKTAALAVIFPQLSNISC